MKRAPHIGIDFQSRLGGGWIGVVLLLAGLAAAAMSVQWYALIGDEIAALEAKADDIKRVARRARGEFIESSRDPKELQQEIRFANAIIQKMAVPWGALFQELESSAGKSVALLSMQPNLQSHQVRISGEARNLEAVFDYARRLGESKLLDQVYLTEHAVRNEQAQKPVVFSLTAQWVDVL
jgi:Tfp pilus assembly protein PilN